MRPAVAALLVAVPLAAAADDLPRPVAAAIADVEAACGSAPATLDPFVIDRQDVNGDGVPDFILNVGGLRCGDEEVSQCGLMGCPKIVLASSKNGFVLVLDIYAHDLRFRALNGRPAASANDEGWNCGSVRRGPGRTTFLWDGTRFACAE